MKIFHRNVDQEAIDSSQSQIYLQKYILLSMIKLI